MTNNSLTLQFIPFSEIENLDSNGKINKLLKVVKKNEIVLMEGRLNPDEETKLIEETMRRISPRFKGIEICTIYPNKRSLTFSKILKRNLAQFLLGNREGLTVIGPATIVKEIKRDPNKIQLLTSSRKRRR